MRRRMDIAEFDFTLPPENIAQRPASPRTAARLLAVTGRSLHDHTVAELPGLLRPGDIMVFNDTRVIPARLIGRRGAVPIETLLHRRLDGGRWRAFAKPGKRLRPGDWIDYAPGFVAQVISKHEGGEIELAFGLDDAALSAALEAHGAVPLPPYIRRPEGADAQDRADYQTAYANEPGAVAAPTAGLHFTPELLAALDERGVQRATVTLHVGAGTFLPVKVDDVRQHRMHAEWGRIDAATAAAIAAARAAGGRVVAVGTTSLRLLESAVDADGVVRPFAGETDIYLLPGHRFRSADLLMTNFHLPRSTLFMLVCAFSGMSRMRAAYEHAITTGYRFYSYGDSSLLERMEDP
jgi:S-adenosylmethionine:tRNA ribosyltransferase-isomerase